MIEFKENELYLEIEICVDDEKIGEAEIELNGKMLSRLSIFPPYQNKGYGTEIVKMLNEKYGCNVLWVNADNKRAIHTYEKNGYTIKEPTMYAHARRGHLQGFRRLRLHRDFGGKDYEKNKSN